MDEIWKDIKGLNGYQVSNLGNVRSVDRLIIRKNGRKQIVCGIIIKQRNLHHAYKYVSLRLNKVKTNRLVHRLVAEAFITNPNNYPQVNHKDEDKSNNHVDNLEWCTAKYNINYGSCTKRSHEHSVKKVAQYTKEGILLKIYTSSMEASIATNGNRSAIQHVCQGHRKTSGGFKWKYIA